MRRLVATLSGLSLVLSGTSAVARTLPNYDALQDAKPAGRVAAGFKPVDSKGPRVAHLDERTGSPTFLWARKSADQSKLSASSQFASMAPEQAALAQIADAAALYGVSSFEAAGARVVNVSENRQGVKVVTLAQEANGIEVFRQSLNLLLNRKNELVAVSGSLSKHVSSSVAPRVRFQLTASSAVAAAYQDLTGTALDASLLRNVKAQNAGKYTHFELATYARPLAEGLVIPARAKQVLFSLPTSLVPAYYVELNTGRPDSTDSDYYSYVISALDGRILLRMNLAADAEFSYRVFADSTPPYTPHDGPAGNNATPHPTGLPDGFRPPYVAPALVTLQNAPFSQNDPWLADDATVTRGNNADAFANLTAPDGYNDGDLRPTVTAPGVFDRTMLFDIQPYANAEQISAATTSLFFMNNWLHDWYYDAGFDEASGNAQADNYGRGGIGNDAIRAQAQDYSGTNNANMLTPADGASPRMRMYLFSGPSGQLIVNAPASVAGEYKVGIASGFGPQTYDVTGDVVVGQDAADAAGPSTTDGCSPLTNAAAVAGKIALMDRGTCAFTVKAATAQAAGAIGLLIADNAAGFVSPLGGTATGITIPAVRITLADGNKLRNVAGLNVHLSRAAAINLDGTVDNVIVAHEWGHYISNRLIQNASGLSNNQGRSMGEGWGDFTALLMITRPEDINVPANANWNGAYGAAEYATRGSSPDSAFFGIRRVTYSSDMAKNPLTFKHITDGVALPTSNLIAPAGNNAEVHNSGEVWATMLWECYTALLRAHPFQEAQDRMKSYLVNGYKLTPAAPTFLEARDAVIASAMANDPADGQRLWQAFAKRGAGVGAIAPDRNSTTHAGVVESFNVGSEVQTLAAFYEDDPAHPGDEDGILDNGESGFLTFVVYNNGSEAAETSSVTVVTSTPGVSLGDRGSATFPVMQIGDLGFASIPVTLTGASTAQRIDFTYSVRDDRQAVPGDKSDTLAFKTNYDEVAEATTSETVEGTPSNLPWSTEYDEELLPSEFTVVEFTDLNRAFFGEDLGGPGDSRLITPELNVGTSAPFIVSFRHSFDFEADASGNYDGAVIELTEDGGATWVDIGTALYNGVLVTYNGNLNPLQGRRAFVGTTAGFPAFNVASVNLGTAYAGKTVQIRFRVGSDNGAANTGWVLDDLSFSGITNLPFIKICDDNGQCGNSAPVISAGPDVTVDERAPVTLSGNGFDADGQALTYTWARVSGPLVTLTNGNTLTPSFTAPDVTVDTDLVLRLSATDGTTTATDTVTVRIRQVNRAPTANAGLDGAADERTSVTLSGSASDADGEALTYLWTQVSGTAVALRGYNTAMATFTAPDVAAAGETLSFRLSVSDGKTTVNDNVDVSIRNVNRAPMVTASSASFDERSTATLTASATDPDGDTVTYSWVQTGGDTVTLSGANTATVSFSTGEVSADSILTFNVSASDGSATATQTVTVTVRELNRAPTVNAGLDATADERATVTLTGSASDEDGQSLTYQWTQTAGTPVGLHGHDTATATFIAPDVAAGETLSFTLTVSDGKVSGSDSVSVSVGNVNRAPMVTASSATFDERSTATLSASASDPDGDTVTYSWAQTGGDTVVLSGANTASVSFSTGEVSADAVLTFTVTVTDGTATATQTVVVNVRQINLAPTVNAGVDGAVDERGAGTLSGSASDADGDALTYHWVQVSGTPVALSNANAAVATFTAPETATGETLSFILTVSDGKSTASDTVEVAINAVNRAPAVTASAVVVDERSTATLAATAADPDSDTLTYAWTQVSGTEVTLTGADSATATFSTGEVTADTELTFRVTVSDGHATATHDVVVTVRQVNRAPVAEAGAAVSAKGKTAVTLDGSASADADGSTVTYQWTQVGGPWVTLTGATTAKPSFTAPDVDANTELTFRLVVSDGTLTSEAATVTVTVTQSDNIVPVAKARIILSGDQTAMTLDGSASSDPDGDALTYKWEQTGGPAVTLSSPNQAVLGVNVPELDDDSATFSFKLTVTDARGGTHTATVEATATPENGGGCSSTGAGAPAGMLGLALLSLLRRRRNTLA
ncbi:myxosortase-dependent M36 family metallopeptidase [Pyxidicoccus caerfyrddinensis]|uniref:myxosortase-dependent M36 family metallopeptidase n=1 Tax=Pyxidicoccus caerfyrddinensis TaxID=2709663 RepID=UPI0013D97DDD|nr:myxosortase-dependent M36 family metallopeptidase [Pyxidicoccus caerfyrddinensis]